MDPALGILWLAAAVAVALCAFCGEVVRRLGIRRGWVDVPGGRKIHSTAVPVTGGLAIFFSFAGVCGALAWVAGHPSLEVTLHGRFVVVFLAALAVLHVMGWLDDRHNLDAKLRLGIQIIVAGALVILLDLRLLTLLGYPLSVAISIFWLITITNAMNFLDNMDGLCGGVGAIAAMILAAAAAVGGQWMLAWMLGALAGTLLGFAIFNLPPARMFMGDAGSMVVGFALGVMSIAVTYYDPERGVAWWATLTPLLVLAVPLYDITSVTGIRLAQGRSPFQPDTQHFSHRLRRKGLGPWSTLGVIYACTLATGLGGIMLGHLQAWQAMLVITQVLAIISILALLERTHTQHPRKSQHPRKPPNPHQMEPPASQQDDAP